MSLLFIFTLLTVGNPIHKEETLSKDDKFNNLKPSGEEDLLYATFLGGLVDETQILVATDNFGNIHLTATTASLNLPTTANCLNASNNGGNDIYYAIIAPNSTGLIYATYLGGLGYDVANRLILDEFGNAFITGVTYSTNYPTTTGAYDTVFNGGTNDAFVTKFDATGENLIFSTFLGGNHRDSGYDIVLAQDGSIYISGEVLSSNFPVTAGAYDTVYSGDTEGDCFISRLSADGSKLLNSTFLGGTSWEAGVQQLAIDSNGNIIGLAAVRSSGFPITGDAWDPSFNGGTWDNALIKMNPTLSSLIYSSYIGGNNNDYLQDMFVDSMDYVYLTGHTSSSNFPTTANVIDRTFTGSYKNVVMKFNPDNTLNFSTYLGGNAETVGLAIKIDGDKNIYISGYTSSTNYPTTTDAFDRDYNGGLYDGIFSIISHNGTELLYSTFIGGDDDDRGSWANMALQSDGDICIGYQTKSTNFPTTTGAYDTIHNGGIDIGLVEIENPFKSIIIPNLLWNTTWGGSSNDYGFDVWSDGKVVYTSGYTKSFGNNDQMLLVKWDVEGNQIWNRTWGGASPDYGYRMSVVGDYIYVTGHTFSYGVGAGDLCIVKWDSNGTLVWDETWGAGALDEGHGIWANETAIYTTGRTNSYGDTDGDLVLIRWNTDGTVNWSKTWGGTLTDYGEDVWSDGIYIYTVVITASFGGDDIALIKWYSNGTQVWNYVFKNTGYDCILHLWGDGNGNLYGTGFTNSFGAGGNDFLVMKWNKDGTSIWNNTWGGTGADIGVDVYGDDTGIYAYGYSGSYRSSYDAAIVKLDFNGNRIYNYTWGGSGFETGNAIWGYNGSFYTTGDTNSWGPAGPNLYLTRWGQPLPQSPILDDIIPNNNTSGDNILLNWTDVNAASSYNVYRSESPIWTIYNQTAIATCTISEYTDNGLIDGKYFYVVTAVNASGESGISNCVNVTITLLLEQNWNRIWGIENQNCKLQSTWKVGNYLYVSGSVGDGAQHIYLAKYDLYGAQIWNRSIGSNPTTSIGYDVWANETAVYVTGWIGQSAFLFRYDTNGNQIWNQTWTGPYYVYAYGVYGVDNAVFACGYRQTSEEAFLIKYDGDGNKKWEKNYNLGLGIYFTAVWANSTTILTTGAYTVSGNPYPSDAVLYAFNQAGDLLFNKYFGSSSHNTGRSLWTDEKTCIYQFGYTDGYGAGNHDFLIVKYDILGNYLWHRTWGGTDVDISSSGHYITDGSYFYIAGRTDSFGSGAIDSVMIKIDMNGNKLWNITWGGTENDETMEIFQDQNTVYTVGYKTVSSYWKMELIKWTLPVPNCAPVILGDIQANTIWTQGEDFGTFSIDLTSNESDVEDTGSDLDWYITGLDTGLVTVTGENSSDDVLTFHSVANAFGVDSFRLWLNDSDSGLDYIDITITITSINDAPIILGDIQANTIWTQNEDFADFSIDLTSNESDIEDTGGDLDWYITGLDTGLVTVTGENSSDDILTFHSVLNQFGTNTFQLWLIDSGKAVDHVDITITITSINDAPIILGDIQANTIWTQNEDFADFSIDLTSNESDIEDTGGDLDWYITGLDTGLVTVTGENSADNILTFHSVLNQNGTDTFRLWLVDSDLGTDYVDITITINSINDAPIILGNIQANIIWTQGEDFGTFLIDLTSNESDIEDSGSNLDWYITGLNTALVTVTGENSLDDILTFHSVSNQYGTNTFRLWLVDSDLGTDYVDITITINSLNDAPVILGNIQANTIWTQGEDFADFSIDLTSNESDVEDSGSDLDWYITGLNTGLVTVTGENSSDDILTFHSVANAFGVDSFRLWLIDSGKAVDYVDITITVTSINDAPEIVGNLLILAFWSQNQDFADFTIDLTSYEFDLEDSGSDLDWFITGLDTSLWNVTGENSTDDILTFHSKAGVYGTDSFRLWLIDSDGAVDYVDITIIIAKVNVGPEPWIIIIILVGIGASIVVVKPTITKIVVTRKKSMREPESDGINKRGKNQGYQPVSSESRADEIVDQKATPKSNIVGNQVKTVNVVPKTDVIKQPENKEITKLKQIEGKIPEVDQHKAIVDPHKAVMSPPKGDMEHKLKNKNQNYVQPVQRPITPEEEQEIKDTESQVGVHEQIDKCIICKNPLIGDIFICPNCKTAKYHRKCYDSIADTDTCWVCHKSFVELSSDMKAKKIQLKQFEKLIEELDHQWKNNEIGRDEYLTLSGQYSSKIKELKKDLQESTKN
jgi:hypothetical protein